MPAKQKKEGTSTRRAEGKSSSGKVRRPYKSGVDARFKTYREFGKYVVADPRICFGKITFRGTRVFVKDVLDMVSQGMDWDDIIYEWHGSITKEAIGDAVRMASQALFDHADEYGIKGDQREPA